MILIHSKWSLEYRLITALGLMLIVITTLFLLSLVGFVLVTILVCILGAWEWGQLIGLTTCSQRMWLAVLCGLLLISMVLTVPTNQSLATAWQVQYTLWIALIWWLVALLLVLYYPRSAKLWRKSRLLQLVFGILIILPFFCGVLTLRQYHYSSNYYDNINQSIGAWRLLYVMVLVWSIDSGAYIFGRMLGYHNLAPKISPSKTWEGLIGGLATSMIITWLFSKYAPLNIKSSVLLFCSIVAALASVLGDLTESMFKREAGIKDSSHLIPGHGGILDRIDSLTAAVPVFTCLILLDYHST